MCDVDFNQECVYAGKCKIDGFPDYPECKRICARFRELGYMLNTCGSPDATRYLKQLEPAEVDTDAFKRLSEIRDNIKDFVNHGNNLMILSLHPRTSKTSWSLKLMFRYFENIWNGNGLRKRGYYLHIPTFLNNVKQYNYLNTDEFKNIDNLLKTVDIVVWDDFIQELNKEQQERLYGYISKRLLEEKANIFNGRIVKHLDEIIGFRLSENLNLAEKIIIKAESYKG